MVGFYYNLVQLKMKGQGCLLSFPPYRYMMENEILYPGPSDYNEMYIDYNNEHLHSLIKMFKWTKQEKQLQKQIQKFFLEEVLDFQRRNSTIV